MVDIPAEGYDLSSGRSGSDKQIRACVLPSMKQTKSGTACLIVGRKLSPERIVGKEPVPPDLKLEFVSFAEARGVGAHGNVNRHDLSRH